MIKIFLAATVISLFLNAQTGYKVFEDVEFSSPGGVSLKLDAHIPEGKGPFPTIILVHGGGWSAGTKQANFIKPLFPLLDSTGYTWFTVDYRLVPKHPFPAAADDVEAAITFVKKNAKKYKVNPKRITIMGESAGGHLVELVGARNRQGLAAVVSFYGPLDIPEFTRQRFGDKPMTENMKQFFLVDEMNPAAWRKLKEASGSAYLSRKTPPFLLIHGTKDEAVPYSLSDYDMKLLQAKGVKVERITVTDGIHGVVNWEKDPKFHTYKQPLVEWLRKTLGQ